MSQEASSGYKGKALDALAEAGCEVGDIIRITDKERVFEGILIPRSETNTDDHIVVKLKSGYNVGIKLTLFTAIERVGKGSKPQFASPPIPHQNPDLPKVVIMSTGGTIASRVDYRTGAVRSALSASDLYGVVPELSNIARVETEIIFSLYSENITPKHWGEIAKAVADKITQGANGIVIAHGTDTMAYTAAALGFALQNLPVPVILVGAQRSSDRPSSDAATNLIGAVEAAARAPFAEVTLAMHQTTSDTAIVFHRGTKVRKCHTSRRDTFKSINAKPIALVLSESTPSALNRDQKVSMLTDDYRKRDPKRQLVLKPDFSDKVALVKFHPGLDPAVIDWYVERGFKGILLEGSGLGHVSKYCFDAIQRANNSGVVVALASQCIWGRVNMHVYDTGRDLMNRGVIPLDDMFPETALVKLMWVLGQTNDLEEAKKLIKLNIAGEFSPRTLPEETGVNGGEQVGD
ncbi:MAG TPA: Glu-tRNA(Gln) amidotransferase subunit GatD [Candidatus Bathyarchaeia archaeon]|nr:Glu-tRNA(Gln) amidotransferase subunit GatD [Candidatus Bathyarchaeia archaeon]